MGLDLVELVLRAEEVFAVDLPNDECEMIRTVGDLYRLILNKLKLLYVPSAEIEANSLGVERPLHNAHRFFPWTTPDVWLTLKALIHDHLGIKAVYIKEGASFVDDLRCD